MEVFIDVWKQNKTNPEMTKVNEAIFTFVALDKQGKTVIALEEKLGMKIDVQALAADEVDEQRDLGQEITFDMEVSKKTIQLFLDSMYQNELVDVYVEGEFLLEVKVSKKAIIKIKKDNNIGKVLLRHIKNGDEIKLYV